MTLRNLGYGQKMQKSVTLPLELIRKMDLVVKSLNYFYSLFQEVSGYEVQETSFSEQLGIAAHYHTEHTNSFVIAYQKQLIGTKRY